MGNPMTKSNEGFRPRGNGQMHEVTVRVFMRGNPGEIKILQAAEGAVGLLARRGYMPTFVESVTREVLDTDESV